MSRLALLLSPLLLAGCTKAPEESTNAPTTNVLKVPHPARRDAMVFHVVDGREHCTTNCPNPRTNVVWFWRGDKQFQWDASPSPGVTGYRVYYGPNRDSLTNVVAVAGLTFLPTNCPAGTNLFAVSAVNSIGLESDLTVPIPLSVFREWVVEDWTKLKSGQVTRLALTTSYFYSRTNLTKELFVRVRGTNQVTRQRTDYVGVSVL